MYFYIMCMTENIYFKNILKTHSVNFAVKKMLPHNSTFLGGLLEALKSD